MEEIDAVSKEQKEKESGVNAEIEKINVFKKELDAEVTAHEKELAALKGERAEMVSRIDPAVYKTYMSLLRDSGDGVAVTTARTNSVRDATCISLHSFMSKSGKNEEIIQCPQCRRILYASEEWIKIFLPE